MSNNTALANTINRYRRDMSKITAEYDAKAKRLEPYAGSKGAAEELGEARNTRDAAIDSLHASMDQSMRAVLSLMEKKLENVPMHPPTEEQLRSLQLLQMRDPKTMPLTREELDSASRTLSSSDECMRALSDIALRHQLVIDPNYRSLRSQATEAIRQLRIIHRGMLDWRGESSDELRARRGTARRQRLYGRYPAEELVTQPSVHAIWFASIDPKSGGVLDTLNSYVDGMTPRSWQLLD